MKYIIGFLVTIGLIILILVLVFTGNGDKKAAPTEVNLQNYSQSATARAQVLIDGPLVSDEDHRQVEITVTQNQSTLTVYRGYDRTIVRTKTYPNNANAFATFVTGLQRANFTKGEANSKLGDERGYCVQNNRYIYSFNDAGKDVLRYWSTSCNQGTYRGDVGSTLYLFENQIPDFNSLTNDQNYL